MENELEIKINEDDEKKIKLNKNPAKNGSIKENLIGRRFGRLLVMSPAPRFKGNVRWNCLCDCGREKTTYAKSLKNGSCSSCGCLHKEIVSKLHRGESFVGRIFGRLTVEGEFFKEGERWCICKCSCGNYKQTHSEHLVNGNTKSCSCLKNEFFESRAKQKVENNDSKIFRVMLGTCQKTAENKGLEFELDPDYMLDLLNKQAGLCVYSGVVLEIPKWKVGRKDRHTTASIDRIDSQKGYIRGNVQLISIICNYAKNSFSHEDMIRFCKSMAIYWKDKI